MTRTLIAALLLATCGCATTGDSDPRDPLEPMNRAIYKVNEVVDEAIARPVATVYRDVVPDPVRGHVRNFFANIADIFIGANNLLQGKFAEGFQDWARFGFNTVFGVFGINDFASEAGFEKHNEDFGQTFGWWGAGPGPYLVLPVLGSSTVRDGTGSVLDYYFDPVGETRPIRLRNTLVVTRLVGVRADLLDASRILEEAALDKYTFQRDAFLQRRRSLVHDGSPPRERFEEDAPREEKKPSQDEEQRQQKRGSAPVNEAQARNVYDGGFNVYEPRIPANYEAVISAGAPAHAKNP
jgi:phospholipid-binding lipoprotein MlaA